ncbi:hypothetical protein HKCCE3408_01025 [Rhodobacterales bacterium HKCCE3408]|nr:hypothetical protein [Rhodobacterales bacterium HKCCE3408]
MAGLVRISVLLLGVLTVVYICLYYYLREGVRMRLEEDWVMQGRPGDRGDWVAERLEPSAGRIRRRLIAPVYLAPLVLVALFVWLTT